MLITPEYLAQNREMHATQKYGFGGHRHAPTVLALAGKYKCDTILDYGCGKGTLAATLGRPVAEYDPAIPDKDAPPAPADFVVCTDVLEHIEPECLDDVLADLNRVTKKAALFVIHTGPAKKILPDGRNAHLILGDMRFWLPKLWAYWDIATATAGVAHEGPTGIMVVCECPAR